MIDAVTLSSITKGLSGVSATQGFEFVQVPTGGAAQVSGPSFADVMKSAASSVAGNLNNAESMSFQGIAGNASTREVVDAMMTADRSLQTAIAIRDKLVSAYLDITKMPI